MLLIVEFFLRSSVEVTSLINKMGKEKLSLNDDKSKVMWAVYSRQPTLDVINGVL